MIDIAKELEGRFDFAAAHFQSFDGRSDLDDLVELFERLRDTVDQIPVPMIERTQELYKFVGPEQFERTLVAAVQDVGRTFAPSDASDFLSWICRCRFCRPLDGLAFAKELRIDERDFKRLPLRDRMIIQRAG